MYLYFKTLHLVALIVWLGPACGASWLLFRSNRVNHFPEKIQLEKFYEEVLLAEHLAFILLIGSGIAMIAEMGFDSIHQAWLIKKLSLVCVIFLIEIFDVWISHISFPRAGKNRPEVPALAWARWFKRRNVFYALTIPFIAGLSFSVIYLAVVKPQ